MLTRTLAACAAVLLGLCAGVAAALAPPPEVGADEPAPPEPAAPHSRRIQVLIAADANERDALAGVLVELMQRLAVDVEIEAVAHIDRREVLAPVPAGFEPLARCFIDLRAGDQALLYVHDPVRDRVLERRAPRAPGQEELAREQLGHMLLAAVEGLLAGAALGAPRAELARAATVEPAAPSARTAAPSSAATQAPADETAAAAASRSASWAVRGALLYEVAALGDDPGFTHGPMLAALIATPLRGPGLGLLLSAHYRFPFDVDADPVGMRTSAFGLRALFTLESALGARVALRAGLGAGADITRIAPATSAADRVDLTDARTLALAVTRGLLGIDVRLSRALSLWAAVSADVDLDRTQYVLVQRGGDDREVVAPWRIRPALSLGLVLP